MHKDFLYCESTQMVIRENDIVVLTSRPNIKWVVKHGWFQLTGKSRNGWYLKSITGNLLIDINSIDLAEIRGTDYFSDSSESPSVSESIINPSDLELPDDFCDGDIATIDGYDGKWVVRFGWYNINHAKQQGWYVQSVLDSTIMSVKDVGVDSIHVIHDTIVSEIRDVIESLPQTPLVYGYIVIPNTNIRLYDNDVVCLTDNPSVKYVVHCDWFIYQGVQNYGWYLCSIVNGDTFPISIIDLANITLVSTYTQGSVSYDGKQTDYTRPFTTHDGAILDRTFISLDTIEQRDNLKPRELTDGRMVRVNDVNGVLAYFSWNAKTRKWDDVTFETTLPVKTGTPTDKVILSQLDPGMYIVKGQYKVATTDSTEHISMGDTLVTVSTDGDSVFIKDMSSSIIADYVVDCDDQINVQCEYVTKQYLQDNYATIAYVNTQVLALEQSITNYINETVPSMIDARLEESLHEITEEYVDSLFS